MKYEEFKKGMQNLFVTVRDFPDPPREYREWDWLRFITVDTWHEFIKGVRFFGQEIKATGKEFWEWYQEWYRKQEEKSRRNTWWGFRWPEYPGETEFLEECLRSYVLDADYDLVIPNYDTGLLKITVLINDWLPSYGSKSHQVKVDCIKSAVRFFYRKRKTIRVRLHENDFEIFLFENTQAYGTYFELWVAMNQPGQEFLKELKSKTEK